MRVWILASALWVCFNGLLVIALGFNWDGLMLDGLVGGELRFYGSKLASGGLVVNRLDYGFRVCGVGELDFGREDLAYIHIRYVPRMLLILAFKHYPMRLGFLLGVNIHFQINRITLIFHHAQLANIFENLGTPRVTERIRSASWELMRMEWVCRLCYWIPFRCF